MAGGSDHWMVGVACATTIVVVAVTVVKSFVSAGVKVTERESLPAFETVPSGGE